MRTSPSGAGTTTRGGARASSLGFDLVVAVLGLLLIAALHYRGWALLHATGAGAVLAPWNIALIVAFVAIALAILLTIFRGRQGGLSWRSATPPGYGMSAVGLGLFLLGLIGDLALPATDPAAIEAVVGPGPLLLAAGAGLIVSGPLRAAWRRTGIPSLWRTHLAMLLSIAALLSAATYVTQSFHPFALQLAAQAQPATAANEQTATQIGQAAQGIGLAAIIVQSALLLGLLLPVIRRWTVPLGAITLILALNIALLALMRGDLAAASPLTLIGVALVAGVVSDLVVRGLRPASAATQSFRIVAFVLPLVVFGVLWAGLTFAGGSATWSPALWLGALALGGLAGWLLSFLIVPTGSTEGPKFR